MLDRLLHGREKDPAVAARIPPGQYRTDKFPVLHYGSVPKTDLRNLGLSRLGRGGRAIPPDVGRVQDAAPQDGRYRHSLRHALVEARYDLGGRADPGGPVRRPGPTDGDARPRATASRATPPTCRSRSWTTTMSSLPTRSTASPSNPSTATRSGSLSPSATSGRAPSGSAASSSSTTTSWASGSATATTTTPTPGRRSATASSAKRRRYARRTPSPSPSHLANASSS